jgi:flagellar hook assembly protein FlgD
LRWDGRDEQGRRVGSGVYFLSMEAQGKGLRKKVVVVR